MIPKLFIYRPYVFFDRGKKHFLNVFLERQPQTCAELLSSEIKPKLNWKEQYDKNRLGFAHSSHSFGCMYSKRENPLLYIVIISLTFHHMHF